MAATFRTIRGSLAGLGVGLGLGALTSQVQRTVKELSTLGKVAAKVGVDAEQLQRLRFGFELTGVAANTTDMALQRFSRRVGEAANGSGELLPILKANNIQLRDQEGNMRSQVDILRDYAELIKNAGSDQERLLLAFKAFDSEGAAFVVGLRNGAEAVDTLMGKADEAGGVIDNELVDRAEDLDDKFAILWRNFEINSKAAIMQGVDYLDRFGEKANEIGNSSFFRRAAEWMAGAGLMSDDVTFLDPKLARSAGQKLSPSARVRDALSGELQKADAELVMALQKRYGKAAEDAGKKTVIPPPGGGSDRNKEAEEALRQAEAVAALIDELEFERSLIGMTEVERERAVALRKAGSAATDEQRQRIAALVEEIHRENAALEANKKAQEERAKAIESLFDMGEDALLAMLDNSQKAEDAIKRLAVQLALAAAQAALLGSGPLAGLIPNLFGGFGGGDPWAGLRIPTAARGFSGTVGGAGGIDSQLAAFRVTPGEQIDIRRPGEDRMAAGSMHVTFGLASDGALNIMPEVREVSQQEAGSVVGKFAQSPSFARAVAGSFPKIKNSGMGR